MLLSSSFPSFSGHKRPFAVASTVALASVFTALAACTVTPEGEGEAPVDQECEVDLNFTTATSVPLELATPVQGFLCPARDQDFYRITIAEPGSVALIHLKMDTFLTSVNPGYAVLKDDGAAGVPTGINLFDVGKSAGEPTDFVGAHRFEEAGDYFVIVADINALDDAFDIANLYTLQVDIIPDPDAQEPNNDDVTATPTTPGVETPVAVTGILATTGDEDWYAVPVGGPAKIIDAIISVPDDSGINHIVDLLAPDGTTVIDTRSLGFAGTEGEVGAHIRAAVSGGSGTVFYLVVRDENGTASQLDPAKGTYSIDLRVFDNPDVNEGVETNDTLELATAVSDGSTTTASVATFGDQDVYRLTPPAGASRNTPKVLHIDVTTDGVGDADLQVLVIGADPQKDDDDLPACNAACANCIEGVGCGEPRLQRFVVSSPFSTSYPVRDARPLYVIVNDFADNDFQEGSYTVHVDFVDDLDAGERGDDVVVPNLESAGYGGNDGGRQFRDSRATARVLDAPFPPICDAAATEGEPEDCMPVREVRCPFAGSPETETLECDGVSGDFTATGRLSYEGDRDYFKLNLPERGYWSIDIDYDISRVTPVELTLFVHADTDLIGNTLEAVQTAGACQSTPECPEGSLCVDGKCWAERTDNPSRNAVTFPPAGECSFLSVVNPRPVYLEVTDNGINDFDADMVYTVRVHSECGCPAACNGSNNFCQGEDSDAACP